MQTWASDWMPMHEYWRHVGRESRWCPILFSPGNWYHELSLEQIEVTLPQRQTD